MIDVITIRIPKILACPYCIVSSHDDPTKAIIWGIKCRGEAESCSYCCGENQSPIPLSEIL